MPHVIVVGGGIAGLATALMLAEQGHEVTVLERDQDPVPGTPAGAFENWERPGVMQFRQPHLLLPGGWRFLREKLPEVARALQVAGGRSWSPLDGMPATITDRAPRPGDERFTTVVARRAVLEHAFATTAEGRVDVRRGVRVTGLLSDRPGHVAGVALDQRAELRADLVIDAAGRRSQLPGWLEDVGGQRTSEESEDSGFTYYTRYFRAREGEEMPPYHGLALIPFDCYSLLTIRSDAGIWSLTVYTSSRDRAFKVLHEESNWTRLIRACPLHERLVTDQEPVTGVLPVSGLVDRIRHLILDGVPAATGILAVGDSWACTNPSQGRGLTLALWHAAITAEAVGEHLGSPRDLALVHHQVTNERLLPWYRATVRYDRFRVAQMNAVIEGRPASDVTPGPDTAPMVNLAVGAQRDADLFRAFLETTMLLARPDEVLARPGMTDRIGEVVAGSEPPRAPGPSRAEALALLS